jgi:hypothetical protein
MPTLLSASTGPLCLPPAAGRCLPSRKWNLQVVLHGGTLYACAEYLLISCARGADSAIRRKVATGAPTGHADGALVTSAGTLLRLVPEVVPLLASAKAAHPPERR